MNTRTGVSHEIIDCTTLLYLLKKGRRLLKELILIQGVTSINEYTNWYESQNYWLYLFVILNKEEKIVEIANSHTECYIYKWTGESRKYWLYLFVILSKEEKKIVEIANSHTGCSIYKWMHELVWVTKLLTVTICNHK